MSHAEKNYETKIRSHYYECWQDKITMEKVRACGHSLLDDIDDNDDDDEDDKVVDDDDGGIM